MKCPVCQNVYSYGRMISHLCDGKPSFFGSIFDKRTPEHQWNCTPYPKTTINTCIPSNINKPTLNNLEKTSKLEFLCNVKPSKILYSWNCQSSQNKEDDDLVLNLTISDKQLVYE